jgi:hypothetical protein
MCINIKSFYLSAALQYYKYMKIPYALFPQWIIKQYELDKHIQNGYIYLELRRSVWGLPQAGILANKSLKRKLAPFGYHKCKNTPELWYHKTRNIMFTLVVGDFGVKYVNKNDVNHLIASIKENYKLTVDWTGNLYCGISRLGLCQQMGRYINAGVHKEIDVRIQPCHFNKVANVSVLT